MKKITGAIFDADGTLFDSMYIWETAGEKYLKSRGKSPKADLQEKLETMTMEESAAYFRKEYGITESGEKIIENVNEMIFREYREEISLKPGVKKVLEDFQKKGIPMYIATSTDKPLIEAALDHNGIGEYFSGMITCTEAGAGKTSPVIYEMAGKNMGTRKEDTVVFEDAFFAAQTAKKAGYFTVGIFDASEKKQEELKELADRYLTSWEEWRADK